MKKALARLLRRGADRLDPVPAQRGTEGAYIYTMSIKGPQGFYTKGSENTCAI